MEGVEFLDVGTNTDTGGLADLALDFDASSLSSGSGSDAGTASSKRTAGSDVRREDITRPAWPDYHGEVTPAAMEAGLADTKEDETGSPRTPPKSVEHQLLMEYKKLKKAQRQKRQDAEKAPEPAPPISSPQSYDDVVTGRRDRTGETCNPS